MRIEIMVILFISLGANSCQKSIQETDTPVTSERSAAKKGVAYEDGVYQCCAEGEGESCCASGQPGMCFQYGGSYGRCIEEEKPFSGKDICALCCEGLVEKSPEVVTDQVFDGYRQGCGPGSGPPDERICVACGNGICGPGENACVCPEDCKS